MNQQRFGRRLHDLREQKSIGRRDYAARVGITESYLVKLESGYCAPPSALTICAMARVLQIDADELFSLAGKIPLDIERDLICSPLLVQALRVVSRLNEEDLCNFLRSNGVTEEKLNYRAVHSRWDICGERRCTRELISAETKRAILKLDNFECVYCSSQSLLEIDHIWPHSQGGTNEPENLITSCNRCNTKKGARVVTFPMVFGRFRSEVENGSIASDAGS